MIMTSWGYQFGEQVARICLDHYGKVVRKSGKPRDGYEWTVLAAIVCCRSPPDPGRIVTVLHTSLLAPQMSSSCLL